MLALVWTFIGGWRGALTAGAAVAVALYGASIYDRLIDDPQVRDQARAEYVEIAKLEAANAQIEELRRQLAAGEKVITNYQEQLEIARRIAAENAKKLEQDIAEYETLLDQSGRSCSLDQRDIDWLRKP